MHAHAAGEQRVELDGADRVAVQRHNAPTAVRTLGAARRHALRALRHCGAAMRAILHRSIEIMTAWPVSEMACNPHFQQ